jgi:hypothetical protein
MFSPQAETKTGKPVHRDPITTLPDVKASSTIRRGEVTIQVRRHKRDEEIMKKRNRITPLPTQKNMDLETERGRQNLKSWVSELKAIYDDDSKKTATNERAITILRDLSTWIELPDVNESDIQLLVEARAIIPLTKALSCSIDHNIVMPAMHVLSQIACGSAAHTQAVFVESVEPKKIICATLRKCSEILRSLVDPKEIEGLEEIRKSCVTALGGAGFEKGICAANAFAGDTISLLMDLCEPRTWASTRVEAVRTLMYACRSGPSNDNVIPCLVNMLWDEEEEESVIYACKGLLGLLERTNDNTNDKSMTDVSESKSSPSSSPSSILIQHLSTAKGPARLVMLMFHESGTVRAAAIRTISAMVQCDVNLAFEDGCVRGLLAALNVDSEGGDLNEPRYVRQCAMSAIASICAGTEKHIDLLLQSNAGDTLSRVLQHDPSTAVQKDGCRALRFLAQRATAVQLNEFVASDCIDAVCDLLRVDDPNILMMGLEALSEILNREKQPTQQVAENISSDPYPFHRKVEECGGVDVLVAVAGSSNVAINDLASRLLSRFDDL